MVMICTISVSRQKWLSRLQFRPRDDKTVEEDFIEPGQRKRLYSQLRTVLSREANTISNPIFIPVKERIVG